MDKENVFRPRKVTPTSHETTPMETPDLAQVQEMQRHAGVDIPQSPEGAGVNIQGNIPAEMYKYIDMPQQQRGPATRPMSSPSPSSYGDSSSSDAAKEIFASLKLITDNYEKITLPSLGRFYDGTDGPTDGTLHVRPMTGNEEKILATPRFVKKGQAVNMIFKNCMVEKFDPEKLLTIDRTYLLIYLRGISYSSDYEVEVKCTECTNKFQTVINLDTLYVDHCPEDFTQDNLIDVLPCSKLKFKYRLSKGKDESMIQDHRERRIKQFGDNAHDDTLLFRASLLLDWIESPSGGILTGQTMLQSVLEQLPINDVSFIRNLLTDPPFGVDTGVNMYCPSCDNPFTVDLPLESNFFFPRTKHKKVTQV